MSDKFLNKDSPDVLIEREYIAKVTIRKLHNDQRDGYYYINAAVIQGTSKTSLSEAEDELENKLTGSGLELKKSATCCVSAAPSGFDDAKNIY